MRTRFVTFLLLAMNIVSMASAMQQQKISQPKLVDDIHLSVGQDYDGDPEFEWDVPDYYLKDFAAYKITH